ncbi:MAG: DUF2188 domain-containing protein [Candidatus Izemoplasmatales bacterium]
MQDIMRFLEEWWIYFAIVGGAIAFLVIVSAIIGRTGRKTVRSVRKAAAAISDADSEKPAEATPPADSEADAATAAVTDAPTDPQPIPASEAEVREAAPLEPTPADAVEPTATERPLASAASIDPEPTPVTIEPAQTPVPEPTVPDAEPASVSEAASPADPVAEPEGKTPVVVKPKAPKPVLGAYRVVYRPEDDKWLVRRDGSDRIQRTLETQTEAVHWATIKALTQDVELIVHKKDGSIRKTPGK